VTKIVLDEFIQKVGPWFEKGGGGLFAVAEGKKRGSPSGIQKTEKRKEKTAKDEGGEVAGEREWRGRDVGKKGGKGHPCNQWTIKGGGKKGRKGCAISKERGGGKPPSRRMKKKKQPPWKGKSGFWRKGPCRRGRSCEKGVEKDAGSRLAGAAVGKGGGMEREGLRSRETALGKGGRTHPSRTGGPRGRGWQRRGFS